MDLSTIKPEGPRSSADAGRLHVTPAVDLYDEDIPF